MKKWKAIVVSTALLGTLGLSGCGCDDGGSHQQPTVLPNYIVFPEQDYLEKNNELLIGEQLGITYKVDPINTSADYDDVTISFDKEGVVELVGSADRTEGYDTFYVKAIGVGEVTITVTTVHREHKASITLRVVQQVQLPAPSNLTFDNGNISWDSVTSASGYRLKISGGAEDEFVDLNKDTTSYSLTDYQDGVDYSISIMAKGVGKEYKDSEYSSSVSYHFLPTITEYECVGHTLSWAKVDHATSYDIHVRYTLEGDTTGTYETTVDASLDDTMQFNLQSIEGATNAILYEVTIIPQSTEEHVYQNHEFDSEDEYAFSISKLRTITDLHIASNGTILDWSDILGATGYYLTIGDEHYTLTESRFDLSQLDAGKHTAVVYATADNQISANSATFTFEKLSTVSGVSVNNSNLEFDANTNASGYRVEFINTDTYAITTVDLEGASNSSTSIYNALKGKPGRYTAKITTLANDNGEYATSNTLESSVSFEVLPDVTITGLNNNNVISDLNNIVLGNSTIIWTKLEQEATYFVYIQGPNSQITLLESDNGEYQLKDNSYSYTLPSDLDSGNYKVFVRAVGNGTTTISSLDIFNDAENGGYSFVKLARVDKSSFEIDSETQSISWGAVTGAVGYAVTEGDVTTFVSGTTYKVKGTGSDIVVVALGKDSVNSVDGSSINSDASEPFVYNKLSKISDLDVKGGKLSFTLPEGAQSASVYAVIDDNTNNPILVNCEGGVIDITHYVATAGSHKAYIYLYLDGYIQSDPSNECTFDVLETVKDFSISKQDSSYDINWTGDEHASGYSCEVTYTDMDGQTSVLPLGSTILENGVLDPTLLGAGSYSVVFTALGDDTYINSKPSSIFTFVKLPNVTPKFDGNNITWQASQVGNISATGYDIYIDDVKSNTETISGTSYTLPTSVSAGSHDICIVAISTSNNVIDSNKPENSTFNKLYDVVGLSVVNGQFTWSKVDGETYLVYDSDTLLETTTNNTLSVQLVAGREYNLSIVATKENNISSNKSSVFTLQKLPSVSGITVSNHVFTFTAPTIGDVERASKYEVYEITDSGKNLIETIENTGKGTYTFTIEKSDAGTYKYVVVAVGSENETGSSGYISSDEGEGISIDVLPGVDVGGIRVAGGKVTWTAVDTELNFDHYQLTIYSEDINGTIEVNGKKFSETKDFNMGKVTEYDFSDYQGGSYLITLQVIGNGAEIYDSSISGYYSVDKLKTPAVTLSNGVVTFVGPTDISGYAYHLFNGETEVTLDDNTSATYLDEGMESMGTYTYTIYVSKDGCIDSDMSLPLTVKRLDTVKNIKLETVAEADDVEGWTTRLSWDIVENATGYKIIILVDGKPSEMVFDVAGKDLHSYDIPNLSDLSGSVDVVIQAIGNTVTPTSDDAVIDGYINSKYSSAVTINTLGQVQNLRLENGILVWDPLENASKYKVVIQDSDGATVDTQYLQTTSYSFNSVYTKGTFNAYVYAWGYVNGNQGYISSATPAILENMVKEDTITDDKVSIKDGVFVWNVTLLDVKNALNGIENIDLLEDKRVLSLFRDVTRKAISGEEFSTEPTITVTTEGEEGEEVETPICSEYDYYNAIRHLITINVKYADIGTSQGSSTHYVTLDSETVSYFNYDEKAPVTDDLAITMTYDFVSSEGYYKISFGNVGNSGNADSEYTLRLAGNMLQEYTVYKAVTPSCATLEGAQLLGYIFNNNVYFNRVFYTDPEGVEKESPYVIEIQYAQNNVIQNKSFVVDVDSDYLHDSTDDTSAYYACVPFADIIKEFSLPTQTSFNVKVRVLGTEDSSTSSPTNTLYALRSSYVDTTSVQVLIKPTLTIDEGQIKWTPSSIAYFQVLRIYKNSDGQLIDIADLRNIAKEMYPLLTDTNIDTVIYEGGIKLPSNRTNSFYSEILTKDTNFDITIQEYGNGVNTITAEESDKRTFRILSNTIGDITLDGTGRYVFTGYNAARVTVYQSNSISGPFEEVGVHLIAKDTPIESQFVFELPASYPAKDSNGNPIYYKIAVQDAPTEDSPMAIIGKRVMDDTAYIRFDNVTNIKVDGFNITWDSVSLVNGYEVVINNKSTIQVNSATEYSLADDNEYPAGDYNISIRANNTVDTGKIIGVPTNITIHKLAAPTLRVQDGDIRWDLANTEDVEGQMVHLQVKQGDAVILERDIAYPHSSFSLADQFDEFDNPIFEVGASYGIFVYQIATSGSTDMNSATVSMDVEYLGSTTLDYGKSDTDATLNFGTVPNAFGYQLVSTTFNLETDEGGLQTERNVKKYVYNFYTSGIEEINIDRVTYSEYTYNADTNEWVLNTDNEEIADTASVVTYNSESGLFNFYTSNINQGLPQGNINYRSYVRALGNTAVSSDEDIKYAAGAFSNTVDTAVPQTPINIEYDSDTGYVTWTNVREEYRPYISYTMNVTINDSYNSFENLRSRVEAAGYTEFDIVRKIGESEVSYTDPSWQAPNVGDTVSVKITMRLEKGMTQYRFTNIGSYSEIAMFSESDTYEKSQLSSTISARLDVFAAGDGSQNNPYQVSNAIQLQNIKNFATGKFYFTLTQNIGINSWETISDFDGFLDLNGKTINYSANTAFITQNSAGEIYNGQFSLDNTKVTKFIQGNAGNIHDLTVTITGSGRITSNYSLFGNNTGDITNIDINMDNVSFTTSNAAQLIVSVLTERNDGNIEGITLSGSMSVESQANINISLVTGTNSELGKIARVVSNANITSTTSKTPITINVAGIAINNLGIITESGVNGTITATNANIAGIVFNNYNEVSSCYNKGSLIVSGNSESAIYVSGLVGAMIISEGSNTYHPTLRNSYVILQDVQLNNSSSNSSIYFGGLIGTNRTSEPTAIKANYSIIDNISRGATGNYYVGLVVAQNNGAGFSQVFYQTLSTYTAISRGTTNVSGITATTNFTQESEDNAIKEMIQSSSVYEQSKSQVEVGDTVYYYYALTWEKE